MHSFNRNPFKVGDWVKSQFKARWTGVVTEVGYTEKTPYCLVKVLFDQNGVSMRKPLTKKLHPMWLVPTTNKMDLK